MTASLDDNVFNRDLGPSERKFKLWRSAGLMLSYWCSSKCACCYVYCGPDSGSAATEMSVEQAVCYWRGLRELAGEEGKVHLTGGEPFGDYARLKAVLKEAQHQGLGGLEKVETNAFWCGDDGLVRERLAELKELGLTKLQLSCDVYHQEYVAWENAERLIRLGVEILGEDGFQVRWRDFAAAPVLVGEMDSRGRAAAFREALGLRKERMLGRAAEELAGLVEQSPFEEFEGKTCRDNFLGAKHIHIDGSANIFSGTCVGIIVDKVCSASLESVWRRLDYRSHPVISILLGKGPIGLLEEADSLGYRRRASYCGKCHLCYEVRRFLYEKGCYKGYLGPGECYGVSET